MGEANLGAKLSWVEVEGLVRSGEVQSSDASESKSKSKSKSIYFFFICVICVICGSRPSGFPLHPLLCM